jgi:hypothetical protein
LVPAHEKLERATIVFGDDAGDPRAVSLSLTSGLR